MKKYTSRVDIKVSVEEEQKPDLFRYASVSKLSKHRCCSCGAPIQRVGIRRVVLCPVCGTRNELK